MDFFQKGYDVSGWDDIKVPSNWELQGFGYPFYVGSGYGIKKNPPLIAVENSPVGSYRRILLFLPIGINARLFFISEEWLLLFMCG